MTTNPSEKSGVLLPKADLYSYDDMLAAWIAGRDNQRRFGDGDGDTPDFVTWIKGRRPPSPPQPKPGGELMWVADRFVNRVHALIVSAPDTPQPVARVVSQAVLQAAYENRPNGQHGVGTEFVSGWTACLEYLAREVASPSRTDTESGQRWREPMIKDAREVCARYDVNSSVVLPSDSKLMLAALKHIGCVIPADRGEGGA